jgi:hypothetical protein
MAETATLKVAHPFRSIPVAEPRDEPFCPRRRMTKVKVFRNGSFTGQAF